MKKHNPTDTDTVTKSGVVLPHIVLPPKGLVHTTFTTLVNNVTHHKDEKACTYLCKKYLYTIVHEWFSIKVDLVFPYTTLARNNLLCPLNWGAQVLMEISSNV